MGLKYFLKGVADSVLDRKKKQHHVPLMKKRLLRFEIMENRELLSVAPWQSELMSNQKENSSSNAAVVESLRATVDNIPVMAFQLKDHVDDNPYHAFLDNDKSSLAQNSVWHQAEEVIDCPDFGGGSISVAPKSTDAVEGDPNAGVIEITRNDATELDATLNVELIYRVTKTVTYFDGTTSESTYEGKLTLASTVTTFTVGVNDATPEKSETVTFTVLSAYHLHYEYETDETTFNIVDNDQWKISVLTTQDKAVERLADVAQKYGEYTFTRSSDNGNLNEYAIRVSFDVVVDTADPRSAALWADFKLHAPNQNQNDTIYLQELYIPTQGQKVEGTTLVRYRCSGVIAQGKATAKLRLAPEFDWLDENELFNPFAGGDPKSQEGEFALIEVVGASWNAPIGLKGYNPVDHEKNTAEVEILDGAILELYMDYDGDGTLDVENSVKNMSMFLGWNIDDDNKNGIYDYKEGIGEYRYEGYTGVKDENDLRKAKLYAWVDELKSVKSEVADYKFDVYQDHPTGSPSVRLWKDELKKDLLEPTQSNPTRTKIGTITQTQKEVSKDFWMERFAMNGVSLVAKAECYQGSARKSIYDGNESTSILFFDVAVDSDNNGAIEQSDIENFLENHEYGLGALVNVDDNLENLGYGYSPAKISYPAVFSYDNRWTIRFEYDESTNAGDVILASRTMADWLYDTKGVYIAPGTPPLPDHVIADWKQEYESSCKIVRNRTYTAEELFELGWDGQSAYIISKHESSTSTYKDADTDGNPKEKIKMVLNYDGNEVASDEIQYLVASSHNFYRDLQNNNDLRYALAASEIYGRNDAKDFCLKLLDKAELEGLGFNNRIIGLLTTDRGAVPAGDGFNAGLYRDYITLEYILAYQGTDFKSVPDWVVNLSNATGVLNQPYRDAAEIASNIDGHDPNNAPLTQNDRPESERIKKNIMLVGHSLGGGLASFAGFFTKLPTTTINAAGFSKNVAESYLSSFPASHYRDYLSTGMLSWNDTTRNTNDTNIRRINTKWDMLTLVQRYIEGVWTQLSNGTWEYIRTPEAIGVSYKINLTSQYDSKIEKALGYGLLYSIGDVFTDALTQLNTSIKTNRNLIVATVWDGLILYGFSAYPGECHRMNQVIFGLLGDDLFGFNPELPVD